MIRKVNVIKRSGLVVSALFIAWAVSGQSSSYDYLLKAKALSQRGKSAEAIDLLSAVAGNFSDYRLLLERADAKVRSGDYKGAIEDYNSSNKIRPSSGEYGLSRVFALQNNAAASLSHLEGSMNSPFRRSEKEIMLDPVFSLIENKPEWRQFWKKEWYSRIDEGISEIEFYLSLGKPDEARAVQSELAGAYSGRNEIIYSNALIEYSSGKYQEAIKDLNRLIAKEPDNEKYLRLLARSQSAISNFTGASQTITRLISLEIPDAGLFVERAECYKKTGELGKSMDDINKYLLINPEDKKGLSMAGKVEAANGDNLKALEFFSENLRLHPGDAECYNDRADAYLVSRSWNWAINDYSMSLDLNPENSDTWLNKGIALVNTGKTEDACHDFRKSLDLGNKRATEYVSRYCIK
jgi:tetratricopeptide (TPR) repeat protein